MLETCAKWALKLSKQEKARPLRLCTYSMPAPSSVPFFWIWELVFIKKELERPLCKLMQVKVKVLTQPTLALANGHQRKATERRKRFSLHWSHKQTVKFLLFWLFLLWFSIGRFQCILMKFKIANWHISQKPMQPFWKLWVKDTYIKRWVSCFQIQVNLD